MPHGPQVPNTIYETTLSLPLSYGKKYLKIVFVGPAMGRVGQGTGALGGGVCPTWKSSGRSQGCSLSSPRKACFLELQGLPGATSKDILLLRETKYVSFLYHFWTKAA